MEQSAKSSRPLVVFSDLDGTITVQDSGCILIDAAIGEARRREFDHLALSGQIQFRDSLRMMWEAVDLTWAQAVAMLDVVQLDPHFVDFVQFCITRSVPVTVLSSGLEPMIEHILSERLEPEYRKHLTIISNGVEVLDRKWTIHFHDDSPFGHDKSLAIRSVKRQYSSSSEVPIFVFIGDGVSDISAAREADILFAKKGKDLEKWCQTNEVPHYTFETFADVISKLNAPV
ncbi:hypothetical protein M427DRAFT_28797 [Gonapodya prolifera JEL478]|uniref:HAD-like protein n=1 Tax=Gonapodya prolifera (strain JEL478) TaxID=1344416 RepID=A0A139AT66_GONPJ|nr:hypothetical protein M427DRAFT_28797 [Gonapodya prolifera JEL478]|eukprot:KXS19930.1 hypothetical protein M427DRAFT_28797 [Gonapodya prolifera JEL478]